MDFTAYFGIGIFLGALGAIIVLILAIIQEGKLGGRGLSVRHGFYAAVSLVLLTTAVASSIFVIRLGLTTWVFTRAPYSPSSTTADYNSTPPTPSFTASSSLAPKGIPAPAPVDSTYVHQCASGCEFTSDEVASIHTWAQDYSAWRTTNDPAKFLSTARRRDLVNALSFLLVSFPLFLVFFRTFRKPVANHPRVVRSVYFYYVALAALVLVVVSGALLVNVALKSIAGVSDSSPIPTPTRVEAVQGPYVDLMQSIVRCAGVCGFTSTEVSLANQWPMDYQTVLDRQSNANTSKTQGDLATNIPLLLIGLPLFLYHFRSARQESADAVVSDSKRRKSKPSSR